jgi:hypothetical protein
MAMKPLPCLVALMMVGLALAGAQTASPFGTPPSHAASVPLPATPAPALGPAPLITLATEQKTGTFTPENTLMTGPNRVTTSTTSSDGTTTSISTRQLGSVTAGATAATWVEITVHNVNRTPITGLAIHYTLYVKSTLEGPGASSISWSAPQGAESIDIPASGNTVVKTTPVPKVISNTATTTIRYPGVESSSASTMVSDIAGWVIEATYQGQPVKKLAHPEDIQDQYKAATGR